MKIGGFQKFSLIDFPDRIAAIVFTQGCNFRCPYCHNPELVKPELFFESIPEEDVFEFLAKREDKLDGVTITGGEPTLQPDLLKFMTRLKNMNFEVKLDTNGTNPQVVKQALELKIVDYIAMDIKAPLHKYEQVVLRKIDLEKIKESVSLIVKSNIEYQFRTTVVPSMLNQDDLHQISEWMKYTKEHIFQEFRPDKVLYPDLLPEVQESKEDKPATGVVDSFSL